MGLVNHLFGIWMVTFAYWLHRVTEMPFNRDWQTDWNEPKSYGSCKPAAGMTDLTAMPGCEDVEISYKHKLAFSIVGFQFKSKEQHRFKGLYVYSTEDMHAPPMKIPLEKSLPHGLNLYELDETTLRIFVTSHPGSDGEGKEEVIVVDFDVTLKTVIQEIRVEAAIDGPLSNDVAAISRNSYVVTHFLPFPYMSLMIPMMLSTLRTTMIAVVEFNDDPAHKGPRITKTQISDKNFLMANGVQYRDGKVYVLDSTDSSLSIFDISDINEPLTRVDLSPCIIDNINFDKHGNVLIAGGVTAPLDKVTKKVKHEGDVFQRVIMRVTGIDSGETQVEVLHMDDYEFSSSVAVVDEKTILLGSPDGPLQICETY